MNTITSVETVDETVDETVVETVVETVDARMISASESFLLGIPHQRSLI